ncbi:MAG: hypothetical protein ACXQTI_01130, partial [Candidatus Nezhaarchaeales archaeon]
ADERLNQQEALYTSQLLRTAPEQRMALIQQGYAEGVFDDDDMQAFQTVPAAEMEGLIRDKLLIDGYGSLLPQGDKGFTLGKGETRYDAAGNVIAQGGAKSAGRGFKSIDLGDSFELVDDSTGETIRVIPKTGNPKEDENRIKAEESKFNRTIKLREQVSKVDPDFRKVEDAFGRIQASAEEPSAAGDLALIFNYMKMLDPGSTVREGEFATAQNAAGVPQRAVNLYNNLLSGERLNPDQRKDFLGRSDKLYSKSKGSYDKRIKIIKRQAKEYGLPFDQIFPERIQATPDGGSDADAERIKNLEAKFGIK